MLPVQQQQEQHLTPLDRDWETGQPAVVFLSELDPDVKNLVKSFKKTTITLASGRPYVGLTAINTNRQYDS